MDRSIYCFWTGSNVMSTTREESLRQLEELSECTVILVTKDRLSDYILKDNPLHPAYEFLSETHKADYLRTYFMHFYGGGYSDIKRTRGSWIKSFEELYNSDAWVCGYAEVEGGVAPSVPAVAWSEIIGNGSYICKPRTPLTTEWYNSMIALLDTKLDSLIQFPATHPRDKAEEGKGYPIEWNEMLGRIFHRICYTHKDKLLRTLPMCVCDSYM